ncbi:transcriptional regulator, AraC family [Enhydrobacter aerosaccus]|uniref:Transcriptional regulator, AraC family n=1 Tax=Enhydrobacter aerosaccus TaxID=225324 RepID=A0A1T4LUE1_9HYPH|nr:AraC family transcriptional regulator [Enhydrobacter aerosaccus]SJZ58261.1 transcriptional regulator, AraC family [Enhydrobacter aerosaccus]
MIDPLAEIVTLLQPRAPFSKRVSAAGAWRIRRTEAGRPFYCVIAEGSCRLEASGHAPLTLEAGDFVLIPSVHAFTMSSHQAMAATDADTVPVVGRDGTFRLGTPEGPPDVRLLVGYCAFGSPDATLLVSLLPRLVLVHGEDRLATLVGLVSDEVRAMRPAREVVLARLLEVLLIEALRSTVATAASPGLLRGLADDRLAATIRRLHEAPARPWTIAQLAREAALSRSAFFERFRQAVGVAPMEYLLAWRMALAKNLLRQKAGSIAEVAQRVGYGSASAFSVAFTRHVGVPPSRYADDETLAAA